MNYESDDDIRDEISKINKPALFEIQSTQMPLTSLGDRDFEILAFTLMRERIDTEKESKYDKVSLMKGVGERGRDCVLYKDGKICGLIQCKKYAKRMDRSELIQEVVKFLLFAELDPLIFSDSGLKFNYCIWAASGFSEPAQRLINNFATEISTVDLEGVFKIVSKDYASFKSLTYEGVKENLSSRLAMISMHDENGVSISSMLCESQNIIPQFFAIKPVVDIPAFEDLLGRMLDSRGVGEISDEDIQYFRSRVESIEHDRRINLGIVDIYGFPKEFYKWLDEEKELIPLVQAILSGPKDLDLLYMKYISSRISEEILKEMTTPYIYTGKISSYVGQLFGPLYSRILLSKMMEMHMPPSVFKVSQISREDIESEVIEKLLKTTEMFLQGDYSGFTGDPALVARKIEFHALIHSGIDSVDDARKQFADQKTEIKNACRALDEKLFPLIPNGRLVVVKDGKIWEDKKQITRFGASMTELDPKKQPNKSVPR